MHPPTQIVHTKTPPDLAAIAAEINEHHSQAVIHAKSALEHAKQAGELLAQAKALVPHGEWLPWLSANCQVSPRQAQRYMRVLAHWDRLAKYDTVSHLTFRGVGELLAERTVEPPRTVQVISVIRKPEPPRTVQFVEISRNDTEPEYEDVEPEPEAKKTPHVSHNSGEIEWYTPAVYIESARAVMGCIDLDPASSELAQQTVQAGTYYTREHDGLASPWFGNVWLNPPYGNGVVEPFIKRLVGDFADGKIAQAISLTNNATETQWFQLLLSRASAVCFPAGRIKFLDGTGSPANTPLQGQAFCYLGSQLDRFAAEFRQSGKILSKEAGQ